jgi:hypothetical protein
MHVPLVGLDEHPWGQPPLFGPRGDREYDRDQYHRADQLREPPRDQHGGDDEREEREGCTCSAPLN